MTAVLLIPMPNRWLQGYLESQSLNFVLEIHLYSYEQCFCTRQHG